VRRNVAESDSEAAELQQINEDRLATQNCLKICTQLSDHITQIQLGSLQRGRAGFNGPESATNETLQECRHRLSQTAARLENNMQGIIDRLVRKSRSTMATNDAADLALLQADWETARQCIGICSKADTYLNENISFIDNDAEGDHAIQYLVSTNGKTIHGKNRGRAVINKQVGGHLSDESLQQISRDMAGIGLEKTDRDRSPSPDSTPPVPDDGNDGSSSKFKARHGRGFKLESDSTPDILVSSRVSAKKGEAGPGSIRM